jgi:hypothetical protein
MNEKALEYSYELFKRDGYNGSLDDYKSLISSNNKALEHSYSLFNNDGYNGSLEEFSKMVSISEPQEEEPQEEELTPEMMETGQRYAAPAYVMTEEKYAAEKKKDGESPSQDGEFSYTGLSSKEESDFQDFINNDPDVVKWRDEFKEEWGEEPQIDGADYDYRGAWKAGIKPKPTYEPETKKTLHHWDSIGVGGKDLKSESHSTRWKSDYMKETGINPDEAGITKEQALSELGEDVVAEEPVKKDIFADETKLDEVNENFLIDGSPVSQSDIIRKLNNKNFLKSLESGESSIQIKDDPEMEQYLADRTKGIKKSSIQDGDEIITPDLMSKEEEDVVPYLNYQFGDQGFAFEESGTGDNVVAKALDSKGNVISEEEFSLDLSSRKAGSTIGRILKEAFLTNADEEANRLKAWLDKNQDPVRKVEAQKREQLLKFKSKEQVKTSFEEMSKYEDGINESMNGFIAKRSDFDNQIEQFKAEKGRIDRRIELGTITQQEIDAFNARAKDLDAQSAELSEIQKGINASVADSEKRRTLLKKSVGKFTNEYLGVLEDQGNVLGAIQMKLAAGIGKTGGGNISAWIDVVVEALPEAAVRGVNDDRPIDEVQDELKKQLKSEIVPAAVEGAKYYFGSDASPEYMEKIERLGADWSNPLYFMYASVLGAFESIPAMVGPSPIGKAKAVKGIGKKILAYLSDAGNIVRATSMAAQVSYSIEEEMAKNPAFKDISENEKRMISAPIAIVGGVLEQFGFRNVVNKSGVLQDITMAVLKKSGKKVTAETFEDLVQKEVKSRVARGALVLTSGALAEAETGMFQEISEDGLKRVYNAVKGKEMFDVEEGFSKAYFKQVMTATLQEAIGGMALGSIGAISSAANNDYYFDSVSDVDFDLFTKMSGSPEFRTAIVTDIKNKINSGEMTAEQGKIELDNIEKIQGALNKIPSGYSAKNKKKALSLLMRQEAIKKKIDGKDKRLTKREQKEIDKIDGLLDKVDDNNFYESEKDATVTDEEVLAELKSLKGASAHSQEEFDATKEQLIKKKQEAKKAEVTDQEVVDELTSKGLPNTQENFDQTKQELLKAKQDAIQEPSTEEVDVQEPARDSREVGEGDVRDTAEEKITVTEETQEVTDETLKDIENVPEPVIRGLAVKNLNGETLTDQEQQVFDANQEAVDQMASDIAQSAQAEGEGRVDSKGAPAPRVTKTPKPVQARIRKQARRAKRALSVILPDIKIVLHDNFESFEKALPEAKGKRGVGGAFDNKKTIHINLESANARTVAHEIFHAAIKRGIKSNKDLSKLTDKMLGSVLRGGGKALNEVVTKDAQGNDVTLKQYLEGFAGKYKESIQSEEQLAEMAGFLAATYMEMGVNAQTAVKAWIAKAAKFLSLGKVSIFSEAMSDKEAIDLLNTIAGATATGKKLRKVKTLKEVFDLSEVVNKDAGKKGLVKSLIDKVLSKKDKSDIAKEEGIEESEVDNAVEKEVENQINNKKPTKLKTLLQKAAAKIKKALVALLIVANATNFMSSGDIVSSKSMAYNNIQVESLEGFNKIPLDQGGIDKKNNIEVINESQKDNPKPYIVVDKSTGSAHLFLGDSLITTFEVGVGEVVGDKETKIKSIYINNETGNQVSVSEATELVDGARYLKDGYDSRTNWDDGTKTTGAGIFKVKMKGDIYGGIGFFLETEQGIVTEMALHTANAVRSKLLSDGNPDNNRLTNGCINFLYESLNEASNNGFDTGSMVFVLPDNANNKYVLTEGTLRFESSDLDVNRSTQKTKPYVAQPVTFFAGKDVNQESKEFLMTIAQYKAEIMALYPSLSNNEYNRLAKIAYGIFGQETSFGTYGGLRGQFGRLKDLAQVELNELGINEVSVLGIKLPTKDPSVGLSQTRLSSIPKKGRDKFDINNAKDLLDNEKSAIATMITIVNMYDVEVKVKEDLESIVPLAWNNRDEFKKANKGDKSTYKNKYVENVNKTASDVSAYIGENPITETEVSPRFQEGDQEGQIIDNPVEQLTAKFQYGDDDVSLEVTYYEEDRMEELIRKGLVEQVDDVSYLNGMYVATTSPDDMLVGYIKVNGKKVAEGAGGLFFVTKFGDVWAFSELAKARTMAEYLNDALKKNGGGKTYLVLAKGTDAKLLSSPQGVTSSLAVLEAMFDANLFSKDDFRMAVKRSLKLTSLKQLENLKKDFKKGKIKKQETYDAKRNKIIKGGEINIPDDATAKEIMAIVNNLFKDVTASTFEIRGNVLKGIIGAIAKSKSIKKKETIEFLNGDPNKGLGAGVTTKSQSLKDLVALVSAEKLTKGLKVGDIYAVIEINGEVEYVQDKHQSYPFHLRAKDGSKPKLILPKNRQAGTDMLTSWDGETAKDLGTGFSGKVNATANVPFGKGIINTNATKTEVGAQEEQLVEAKFQDPSSNEYTIFNVVNDMRGDGYTDSAIALFLSRQINPSTGKKYTRAEVKDAMAIPVDIERSLPVVFGDVEGGVAQGQKLFVEVMTKLKASVKRMMPKTNAKMRAKAHELLKSNPIFKEQSKVMQNKLLVALDQSLGTTANQVIQSEIAAIKRFLSGVKAGDKQLRAVQVRLKALIRKNLPQAQYKKSEVDELIRLVSKANSENIQDVVDQIVSKITEKKVEILEAQIEKIINTKSVTKQLGRAKGQSLDVDFADALEGMKKDLADATKDIEALESVIEKLTKKRDELFNDSSLSNKTLAEIAAIDFVVEYLKTKGQENNEQSKVDALQQAKEILEGFIKGGRSLFKEQLKAAHESYVAQADAAFKDITGIDLADIDMDIAKANLKEGQEATPENLQNAYREYMNAKYRVKAEQREANKNRAVVVIKKMLDKLNMYFHKHEDVTGLMDIISKSVGDMFGGYVQETVTDRVDDATYVFKQGKKDMRELLESNMKRIFGKKWKNITMRKNNEVINTGVIIKGDEELILSQNEIYYFYNMAKDPANNSAFEGMWGKDWKSKMKTLEGFMTPEVKEWADWQVNEFYPQMYERYNEIYRRVYRTNLPWNQFYAGKIHRDGDTQGGPIDMLDPNSSAQYHLSVAGGSTKMRQKNSQPIKKMSGNDVLTSYILEMERFRAFQEVLRDISKMLNNKLVSNAIIKGHGKDLLTLINRQMGLVATGGFIKDQESLDWIGTTSRFFVFNKIAGNLVVTLKQLTSIPTFANDIGIRNWTASFSKLFANPANAIKLAKEVYNNSIYIQDRYGQDFLGVIDVYQKNSNSLMPQGSKMSDAIEMITKIGMSFTKAGDAIAIFVGGVPNYAFYKSEFQKKNPTATEEQAIAYAIRKFQKDTKKTQQSGDIQDRDYYQTAGQLVKAMSLFLTTPKQYHRKSMSAYRQLFRKMSAMDRKAGKGTVWENTRTLLFYRLMMPMFFQWVSMGAPPLWALSDDEEDELKRAALLGNINALWIVGDLGIAIKDYVAGKPWAGDLTELPFFSRIEKIIKIQQTIDKTKDEVKKQKWKDALTMELMDMAMPAKVTSRLWNNWNKIATGEEDFNWRSAIGYSDYVIDNLGKNKEEEELIEKFRKKQEEFNKKKEKEKNTGPMDAGGGAMSAGPMDAGGGAMSAGDR